jgi:hypothetical protein
VAERQSQPASTIAAAAPAPTPPATAQASTGPATQVAVTGMLAALTLPGYCTSAVDSSAAAVTTRSAASRNRLGRPVLA